MLLDWLQGAELEQIEGSLLIRGGRRDPTEGRQFGHRRLHDLLGLGGQGLEDTPEILDGKAVRRDLFGFLAE